MSSNIEKLKKLSPEELCALVNISIGFDKVDDHIVYKKLEKKDLIIQVGMQQIGKDKYGNIEVPVWQIPSQVNSDWDKFCAEEELEEDEIEITQL